MLDTQPGSYISVDKTRKLEYRIRFDAQGTILGESSDSTLARELGFNVDHRTVPDIFTFVERTSRLDKGLPQRLVPMVQRLLEKHEEFALNGDFPSGDGKRHLRISGQAIRNVSGEYTHTLLLLDDTAQTELRRSYEYMFRLAQHELKGPLAVIQSAAEMANEQIDSGETDSAKGCLAMIERNAFAIEEMITRYLNLSRIESGAIAMTYEPLFFSSDILDPIVAEMQLQLSRKNMHVTFRLVGLESEPAIVASREGCGIVMRNLLSNAIKYGESGTHISVTLGRPQDDVLVAVKNKGPNIPEEYLSKLFQRFVRLEATQGTKGSGLGLYNARKLVELWGGTIAVNSGDNETRFTFTMPQPEFD